MRLTNYLLYFILFAVLSISSCRTQEKDHSDNRIDLIIDTDANNELDDQHALAYAFCNSESFNLIGVTVNSTRAGGNIEEHYKEAVRIAHLCKAWGRVPIKKGAEGRYSEIAPNISKDNFDGKEAVDFIIERSGGFSSENKLCIVAIGKLSNIALAIEKDSTIIDRVKLIWLGSNYPDPGEYNLENDTTALNPVFQSGMETEIALVAYGRGDGTDAVKIPIKEVERIMPGLGPHIADSIEGRNGGYFHSFGDYAVNLWQNMKLYGESQSRSLFDLAAVVIVKKPGYSDKKLIPAPFWKDGGWDLDYETKNQTVLYHNFKKDSILNEFFESLENCQTLSN